MKILNRQQFQDTPAGTLFSYNDGYMFYGLKVKASDKEHWETDFIFFDLIGSFEYQNSEEHGMIIDNLLSGASIPTKFCHTSRDGLFDDEQLFLVYDKDDIAKIISFLQELL